MLHDTVENFTTALEACMAEHLDFSQVPLLYISVTNYRFKHARVLLERGFVCSEITSPCTVTFDCVDIGNCNFIQIIEKLIDARPSTVSWRADAQYIIDNYR
jgi:hypothetical protein